MLSVAAESVAMGMAQAFPEKRLNRFLVLLLPDPSHLAALACKKLRLGIVQPFSRKLRDLLSYNHGSITKLKKTCSFFTSY